MFLTYSSCSPGLGRTLHLTKDMNDQMVEFGFQVKGES